MSNLGALFYRQGRYDEAGPLYRQALQAQKRSLGEEHRSTLVSMSNLAQLYHEQGRFEDAAALFEETVPRARRAWSRRS